MGSELVTTRSEDFFGKPVTFREAADASLWLTAEQAAIPLGFAHASSVRKLLRNHKAEFIDGVEFATVSLDVAYVRPSEGRTVSQKKNVVIFSLAGLDHLALLVRNEVGVKARRWTVDLRERMRRGEAAVVSSDPADLLKRLLAERDQIISDSHRQHMRALEMVVDSVTSMSKRSISLVAQVLALRGIHKKREAELMAEVKKGQLFLLPSEVPKKLPG